MQYAVRTMLVLLAALAALALSACAAGPLVSNASVEPNTISPNADGDSDVARIAYTIRRPSSVSIYFVDDGGARHYFRQDRHRGDRDYNVLWGGVIAGRVLPDGEYTWVIEAADEAGNSDKVEGKITLREADTNAPEFQNFAVNPALITPNQDGIGDRASITYWLTKEVEEIQVYLLNPADPDNPNQKYPLAEVPREVEPTDPGYHFYDYDGGIDLGADPPPDGAYIVVAEARDRAGNHTVISDTLTIENGGKPRAEIVGGEVQMIDPTELYPEDRFNLNLSIGGAMIFTATVENYGNVPLRTAGPWPGATYFSDQNFNTLAYNNSEESWFEQSGTWRFGLNFESNFGQDWPFRFAVGRHEDLRCEIIRGHEQCFLDPGERGLVYGAIIWLAAPPDNPFRIWGGLLHEDVAVVNNSVDVHEIQIADPEQ